MLAQQRRGAQRLTAGRERAALRHRRQRWLQLPLGSAGEPAATTAGLTPCPTSVKNLRAFMTHDDGPAAMFKEVREVEISGRQVPSGPGATRCSGAARQL